MGRLSVISDFPGGSDSKASVYNAGDRGSIPGSGRSTGEGNGNPLTPVLLPGKSHGQRSLVGYSPWGRKESDTTEQRSFLPSFLKYTGSSGALFQRLSRILWPILLSKG